MPLAVKTHLMFTGDAEEAMEFYISLFDESEITDITRYEEDSDTAGQVKQAHFTLGGREFVCIDSPPVHAFDFTPSISIYIDCEDDDEIEMLFEQLSEGGEIMMPLDE